MFFRKSKVRYQDRLLLPTICPLFSCSLWFLFAFTTLILLPFGDTESNPGARRSDSYYNFLIYHWGLNSTTAHNFEKANLLACNTINKFDIICLSECYLDSSIASNNDKLNIKGYNLYKADHLNNFKRGGVCAYIRESLPVRCLSNAY